MDMLFMFYPLAKASNVGEMGSFARMMDALRLTALKSVGVYVSAVLVIVSLILVFKLVKMSYSVMSDEQSGGFGGVKLWDVLRPLVIVLVIQNCSFFVNLLDSGVSAFTTAMFNKVNENVVRADTGEEIDKFEKALAEFDLKSRKGRNAAVDSLSRTNGLNNRVDELKKEAEELKKTLPSTGGYQMYTDPAAVSTLAEIARIENKIKEIEDQKKTAAEALGEYMDCDEELKDPRSHLAAWATWLYDRFVFVMICLTDIILCAFVAFAPLVFALSLFDKWRDSLMNWVGGYIQVSLWKVTVAIINWCVVNARTVALSWIRDQNLESFKSFAKTGVSGDYVNSGSWLVLSAAIAVAGLLAVLMTPTITHMILSLGSAPSQAEGAAKSTFMSPVSAAKGAANIGSKFMGK